MATAAPEAPVNEAPAKKRTRKRTKASYMEENGLKSLSEVPSIPDEYNPDKHLTLKEAEFDDVLDYHRYLVAFHNYHVQKHENRVNELKSMDPEDRQAFSQGMDKADDLIALFKKMVGTNPQAANQLLARVNTGLTAE